MSGAPGFNRLQLQGCSKATPIQPAPITSSSPGIDKVAQRGKMGRVDRRLMRLTSALMSPTGHLTCETRAALRTRLPASSPADADRDAISSHTRLSPRIVCVSFLGSGSASALAVTKHFENCAQKEHEQDKPPIG
ncbi:hypothetical protein CRV24_009837 [Beauveria bassiana]|nr:hypothetical protein CRV24_009837 [Beauveria bassiana]